MGDLEVWVNGIINTISGVDDSTTCRDTVIALAQSFGLTGCFNLVEKTPTSERRLHPSECPVRIREKWGDGSPNYFVLRKRVISPSSSRPSSSNSQSSPSHARDPVKSSEPTLKSSVKPLGPPPAIKPKPVLTSDSKHSRPSQNAASKPKPVPRKAVAPSQKVVDDVPVMASNVAKLSHQPDLLVKAPSHPTSISKQEKSPQQRKDHEMRRHSREEEEILKQHEERAEALELERQKLQRVESALRRNRREQTLGNSQMDTAGSVETEQQQILREFKWKQDMARRKEMDEEDLRTKTQSEKSEGNERPESNRKEPDQEVRLDKQMLPHELKTKESTHRIINQKKQEDIAQKRDSKKASGNIEQLEEQNKITKDDQWQIDKEKQKLEELVKEQESKLNHQKSQLSGLDAAIQALLKFESDPVIDVIQDEITDIERTIQKNQAMLDEKQFWENELELEREMHKKLEASVGDLKDKVADCNRQISQKREEISKLSKAIKVEEKKLKVDDVEESREVKAVKEELRELKNEYETITENLQKVEEKLRDLDREFQEKQKELQLVEEDYEKARLVELEIIIPDNRIETSKETDQPASSPSLPHRILKGSPRELAVATPSSDNPEGVFL